MKTAFYVVIAFIALGFGASSCAHDDDTKAAPIEIAEKAFADGRYAKAQSIADSIMLGPSFADLDVAQLCRLSMLLTRLGESSTDEEVNTAMAARALEAASALDSDSTASFIRNVPLDDRARVAIVTALSTARGDSLIEEPDSLIY